MANSGEVDKEMWMGSVTAFYASHAPPAEGGRQLGYEHHPSETDPKYEQAGVLSAWLLEDGAQSPLPHVRIAATTIGPAPDEPLPNFETSWRRRLRAITVGVGIGMVVACFCVVGRELNQYDEWRTSRESSDETLRQRRAAIALLVDDEVVQRKMGLCASELEAQAEWVTFLAKGSVSKYVLPAPANYQAAAALAKKQGVPCTIPKGEPSTYTARLGKTIVTVEPHDFTIFDVATVCRSLLNSQLQEPSASPDPGTKKLNDLRLDLVEKEDVHCE